ncbi:DUF881 domain-containing protein [Aestuariimicrobium ganziense]|uniref:DUF881 domain-containing protein n=1 Tax=Aestuariimicrobium ganziense TaxID=2773677 RepID=UPI001943CF71|nr:DUF881 domain-containing protein [Aestuariimicrobium ganziense]
MSLLRDLDDTSLDPDYERVTRTGAPPRRRWVLFTTLLLAGAMFGLAAIQTARSAPALQRERDQLVGHVKAAEAENRQLQQTLLTERQAVRELQEQALASDPSAQAQLSELEVTTGAVAVVGPGVVVIVDDAPTLGNPSAVVVDQDLRQLVNGLWASGAEAIAINGHRLSTRTAIRGAGSAITVDYVSLTPPYRVEAIGDPKSMPAALQESSAGAWWLFLKQNYGMRYEVSTADELRLNPDANLATRHAVPPR